MVEAIVIVGLAVALFVLLLVTLHYIDKSTKFETLVQLIAKETEKWAKACDEKEQEIKKLKSKVAELEARYL